MYSPSRAISQGCTQATPTYIKWWLTVMVYGLILCMWAWLGYIPGWLLWKESTVIRSTLIWWYACYYITVNFMHVGMTWVYPWLHGCSGEYRRLTLIIIVVCMLLYKGWFYVLYKSSIEICVTNVVLVQRSEFYFSFSFNIGKDRTFNLVLIQLLTVKRVIKSTFSTS